MEPNFPRVGGGKHIFLRTFYVFYAFRHCIYLLFLL
nr:MAG TPA: hypothetical protein [Caudoviricetes sp.]